MSLTDALEKSIVLDIQKGTTSTIKFYQFDTARRLLIYFTYDNEVLDLTGKVPRLYMIKPDGEEIFSDLEVTDATKGEAQIEFDENMLSVPGTMYCDVTIYEGGKTVSTSKFTITISKPLRNDRSITSTSEYASLTAALTAVDNCTTEVEKYNEYLESLTTASPKGSFESLAELESAYPLGDNNIYLTKLDDSYYVTIYEDGVWKQKFKFMTDELEDVLSDLNTRFNNAINSTTTDTEVIDARVDTITNTTYTTLSERLLNIVTNINSIQDKMNTINGDINIRSFNPLFTCYIWTKNTVDSLGNRTVPISTAILQNNIDNIKECGFDGVEVCIHINFNESTNDLYYETDLATIDYIINSGLKVYLLKFHQEFTMDDVKTMGVDAFKTKYKSMIEEVCTKYKSSGIEYLVVLNEFQHMWAANRFTNDDVLPTDFVDYTKELIQAAQGYGFKVGVSTAGFMVNGWSSFFTVDRSIYDIVDGFFTNGYPPVGIKGSATTKEDCYNAWINYDIWKAKEWINNNYPSKFHIHTETGVLDNWNSLYAPGNYTIGGETTRGEIYLIYLYGLFEALNNSNITIVNWWYTEMYENYSEKVKPLIVKYLGGVNK